MNKEYKIKLHNKDADVKVEGYITKSVVDKINANKFVEFNLRIGYELGGVALYERHYFSPVSDIDIKFIEER